jgi:hypothetical protein
MYKRELLSIVEFCRKYYYLFRTHKPSVVYTDHKPLTFFLRSPYVEGIYARWATVLGSMNLNIEYIPGPQNKHTDALSRTIFPFQAGADELLDTLGRIEGVGTESKWVWKDGKGGYEELLQLRSVPQSTDTVTVNLAQVTNTTNEALMWSHLEALATAHDNTITANVFEITSSNQRLAKDLWYRRIYTFLTTAQFPDNLNRLQKRSLQQKCANYRLIGGDLFYQLRGVQKRCVLRHEVAEVLYNAHDLEGHFAIDLTIRKLREYYWPTLVLDVRNYIAGCLQCAKHGTAVQSQSLSPISISRPNKL